MFISSSSTDYFPSNMEEIFENEYSIRNDDSKISNPEKVDTSNFVLPDENMETTRKANYKCFTSNPERLPIAMKCNNLDYVLNIKCFIKWGKNKLNPHQAVDYKALLCVPDKLILSIETDQSYSEILKRIQIEVISCETEETFKKIAYIVLPQFEEIRENNRLLFQLKVDKNSQYLSEQRTQNNNDSAQQINLKISNLIVHTLDIRGVHPDNKKFLRQRGLCDKPNYLNLTQRIINESEIITSSIFMSDNLPSELSHTYFNSSPKETPKNDSSMALPLDLSETSKEMPENDSSIALPLDEFEALQSFFPDKTIQPKILKSSCLKKAIQSEIKNNQLLKELDTLLQANSNESKGYILKQMFGAHVTLQNRYTLTFLRKMVKKKPDERPSFNSRTYLEIKTDYDSREAEGQTRFVLPNKESIPPNSSQKQIELKIAPRCAPTMNQLHDLLKNGLKTKKESLKIISSQQRSSVFKYIQKKELWNYPIGDSTYFDVMKKFDELEKK